MKEKRMIALTMSLALIISALGGCSSKEIEVTESTKSTQTTTIEETEATTEETTEETTVETSPAETITNTVIVDNSIELNKKTYPVVDGSTSMKPLAIALRRTFLNESEENATRFTEMHRTTKSFDYLIEGSSELLLVAQPNQSAFDAMNEASFDYEMEKIAVEGLVFMVNSLNPVDSLTIEQLQGIYSGQITNWSEVGGDDMPIIAFQRNSSSGSQVMMIDTVMGDIPMMEVGTEMIPTEMGELIECVRSYDNSANAIGYTVYYYASNMDMADGLKLIKIEGVEPSEATLASGEYPLLSSYFAVMASRENASEGAIIIYDWLVSDEGKNFLSRIGYVPVAD